MAACETARQVPPAQVFQGEAHGRVHVHRHEAGIVAAVGCRQFRDGHVLDGVDLRLVEHKRFKGNALLDADLHREPMSHTGQRS